MNYGDHIDTLYQLRSQRLALEKEADELKKQEKELEDYLVNGFSALGLSSAKGSLASFSFVKLDQPNVKDWDLLYKFIVERNDFSLLHKRIGAESWREYLENDSVLVPGTEIFKKTQAYLRKI
jgi:hypothetical protein